MPRIPQRNHPRKTRQDNCAAWHSDGAQVKFGAGLTRDDVVVPEMSQEPAGKTGMAAGAENCLLLIAQSEGMVHIPRRNAWPLSEDERADLLTEDVLRRLASLSDARLLAQRLFSETYLAAFRARYPRDSALLERVQVSRADEG